MSDLLTLKSFTPALSATSDKVEIVADEPVANNENSADDNAQAAPNEGTTPDNSATPDETDSQQDEQAGAPKGKTPRGVQKKFDELTKRNGESARLAQEQSQRLEKALSVIEQLTQAQLRDNTDVQSLTGDPKPVRGNYDDPDMYTESLAQWSAREAVRTYQAQQAEQSTKAKVNDEFQTVVKTWETGRTKAIESYPDYEEVAENPDLPIANHVAFAIARHTKGHDIAYYLGKNPDEAKRISEMSPVESAMAIGSIGEKISSSKAQVSKAPAPVKPLGVKNNAGSKTPEEESMEEYAARRNAERRAKK
jgi:hypothetical protein